MSRTYGHAPYWTWAEWYEPNHHMYCEKRESRWGTQPCNLPERPVRHAGRRTRVYVALCTWEPVWPMHYSNQARLFGRWNPPRWFRRHVWEGVERARQRATLGRMVKEHNATGELEDGDFPNYQHRHGAAWDWH